MPSIDLQDAKALRAQDDAIPHSPIPDPADATQDSPVEPTPTPGPRRSTRSTRGVAPQRVTYQVRGQPTSRSTRGMVPQRVTHQVRGLPTTYYLSECLHMIKWLVACDQREYEEKIYGRTKALVKEIEKKLQLCYYNKSEILSRVWKVKNESEITTFWVKHDAVYQYEKLTSRLMDWVTTAVTIKKEQLVTTGDVNLHKEHLVIAADVKQNKGHSSSIELA